MKRIYLLILPFFLISCGAQKSEQTERQKVTSLINSKGYSLQIPKTWGYILDYHNDLAITPINLDDEFTKCIIQIYRWDTNNISLEEFVENRIDDKKRVLNIESDRIFTINTRFGETHVYEYDYSRDPIQNKGNIKYFNHDNNFYIFSYSGDEKYFNKFLNDVESIFTSLTFNK